MEYLAADNDSKCLHTKLLLNGKNIEVTAGKYAAINKIWSATDVISLSLEMRGQIIMYGKEHRYAAIQREPILLCRDSRLSKVDLGISVTPVQNKDGSISLRRPESISDDQWIQTEALFSPEFYKDAPETPILLSIALCDYASAGNGHQHSCFQVWIPQII